jgi:hypothetical protein
MQNNSNPVSFKFREEWWNGEECVSMSDITEETKTTKDHVSVGDRMTTTAKNQNFKSWKKEWPKSCLSSLSE